MVINKKTESMNILNILIPIIVIIIIGGLLFYIKKVTIDLDASKNQINVMEKERTALSKKLEEIILNRKAMEKEIDEFKEVNMTLKEKTISLNDEIDELKEIIVTYANEIENLQKEAEKAKSLEQIVPEEVTKLNDEIVRKSEEITMLRKTLEEYKNQNKELQKNISQKAIRSRGQSMLETAPIIVSAPVLPKVSAEVLEVNKEHKFIVANIGSINGIKKGNMVFISKNKKLLGRAVIEEVAEDVCVAKPVYEDAMDSIEIGDKVIY